MRPKGPRAHPRALTGPLGALTLTPYSCSLRKTGLTGLEPATSGVTDRHSNQLSYSPNNFATPHPLLSPPT